jgi:hypothetical protein
MYYQQQQGQQGQPYNYICIEIIPHHYKSIVASTTTNNIISQQRGGGRRRLKYDRHQ